MPITFTEEDFQDGSAQATAPAEPMTFSEDDFAEPQKQTDFTPPSESAFTRITKQGANLINPMLNRITDPLSTVDEAVMRPLGLPEFTKPAISPEQVGDIGQAVAKNTFSPQGLPPASSDIEKGVAEFGKELASGLTTPENIFPLVAATKLATRFIPKAIQTAANVVVPRLFQTKMAAGVPQSIIAMEQAANAGQPVEVIKHALNAGAGAIAPLHIETALRKGEANASRQQEAAEVHGDVRSQQQPPGELPVQESGEGVQPRAEEVAKETQVSLTPEDQKYLDDERKAIDTPVEVVDQVPEGQPFAGQIATIDRQSGKVLINGKEFSGWLKDIPEENRAQAVRSLLSEERIHLATDDTQATAYWNTLTAAEKAIAKRRYTGTWSGTKTSSGAPVQLSDTAFGHEALRFRMQQLARMTPREIAEAVGREKWTMQGITAIESVIRTAREKLGTKASGEAVAILDRVQQNLNAAKVAMGAAPGALAKSPGETKPEEIASMTNDEASSFFDENTRMGNPAQKDAVRHGVNLKPEDVPRLKEMADKAGQEMRAAIKANDNIGYKASFGKHIWFNGAIEAAAKRGPNYHRYLADSVGARFDGEIPGAPGKTLLQFTAFDAAGKDSTSFTVDGGATPEEVRTAYNDARARYEGDPSGPRPAPEPGALRKGKAGRERQQELWLPPAPKAAERPGARELGATPVTPFKAEKFGYSYLQRATDRMEEEIARRGSEARATPPSFRDFVRQAKMEFGEIQPGQLADIWEKNVWRRLFNASGSALNAMRRGMKLETKVGERPIADPTPRQKFELEQEGEGKVSQRDRKVAQTSQQRYRASVIRTIGSALIEQSRDSLRSFTRSSIDASDLSKGKRDAYVSLTSDDASNPRVLADTLTEGARASSSLPESVTKRVTVLLDKSTGKVYAVDTYKHRNGAMVLDPLAPGKRAHVPLERILKRYQPIASVHLDEPVQNFKQGFESLSEFEDKFGSEARTSVESASDYEAALSGEAEEDRPGTLARGEPLTDAEAVAVLDHLNDEVGKIESREDMDLAVQGLEAAAKEGRLTPRHRVVISALEKSYQFIKQKWPQLTDTQAVEQVLDQYYDNAQKSESSEAFAKRAMGEFTKPAAETVQGKRKATTGARELEMFSRPGGARTIPPTVDPNVVLPKGPGPEPTIPVRPPRMLSPEGVEAVKAQKSGENVRLPSVIYRQLAERKVPTEKYTMGEQKRGITPIGETEEPGALRKAKQAAKEGGEKVRQELRAVVTRGTVKKELPRLLDGAERAADQYSLQARDSIELASAKPGQRDPVTEKKVRGAAKAVIATGQVTPLGIWTPDRTKLNDLFAKVQSGMVNANAWMRDSNPVKRFWGRKWLKAAGELHKELEYARDHWNDPELQNTAQEVRKQFEEQIAFENANGFSTAERENYVPGRYEAEFFNDRRVSFAPFSGVMRVLGEQFRKGKVFSSYYDAIKNGPYIPASYDVADIAQNRISRGQYQVAKRDTFESFKSIRDPESGQPIAKDPRMIPTGREITDPATGITTKEFTYTSPSPEHELVYPTPGGKPIAVREGFAKAIKALTLVSQFEHWPGGKEALMIGGMLKHGGILVGDLFHASRLGQIATAISGKKFHQAGLGYKGGYSALAYKENELGQAVAKGFITPESAAWATERIPVNMGRGVRADISRAEIARELLKNGMNAMRLTDGLYKDAVQKIPFIGESWHKIIGKYNRWLFDRYVPGLMIEGAVRNFERLNSKYPDRPLKALMTDVVRDTNVEFGNMGRQGVFKNPTFRDFAQVILLAPSWAEGLLQKEARFYGRVAKAGYQAATGNVRAASYTMESPLVRGMVRGLTGYFILTQAINLITKGHLTFQNEEKGHKLDAWIPTGKHSGVWVSPLSVFAEVTHDVIRLSETKPKVWDAIRQIGENKLGPITKAFLVLASSQTPAGVRPSTTAGVLGSAAAQLIPTPISAGPLVREGAHAVAPGMVSPNRPGTLPRSALSFAGIKAEVGRTSLQNALDMARRWKEQNNVTAPQIVPTDEASYNKLRGQLRNGDTASAKQTLAELRKNHSDDAIMKAMRLWSKHPFTGSKEHEDQFKAGLSDQELQVYNQAMLQKMDELDNFQEWFLKQP